LIQIGEFSQQKTELWLGPVVEEPLNWNRKGGNLLFSAALFFNN
jgi:hypothetical protein